MRCDGTLIAGQLWRFLWAPLASLALVGSASGGGLADATVIGRTGNQPVAYGEIRDVLEPLLRQATENLSSREVEDWIPVVRSALLRNIILSEVRAADWESTTLARAAVEQARQDALVESYLSALTSLPETYPTEEEIRTAYENASDSLRVPMQWQLAQIFIADPVSEGTNQRASRDRKLAAVEQSLATADAEFGALAREWSDEPLSRENNGLIGWLSADQILPELRPHVASMRAGETVGPIRRPEGWHWIQCLDFREASLLEYETVRARLRAQLRMERQLRNREAYLARLLKQYPIAVDQRTLARLLEQ